MKILDEMQPKNKKNMGGDTSENCSKNCLRYSSWNSTDSIIRTKYYTTILLILQSTVIMTKLIDFRYFAKNLFKNTSWASPWKFEENFILLELVEQFPLFPSI